MSVGDTTVTCTATDGSGNSAGSAFVVHVVDTTPPELTMPANQTAAAESAGGAVVAYPPPEALDIVDGFVAASCSIASASLFPLGDTTVACTAIDGHGNATTASFVVRIQDEAAPQVQVPAAFFVEATSAAGATVPYGTVTATDNVDGDLEAICQPPSGSVFPLGATTVGCSATDAAGNDGSQTFSITVEDTTAPSLTVSGNIAVTATSSEGATVAFPAPSASDIVSGEIAPSCSADSGSLVPLGTTTVTCSATDEAGNQTNKSFTVTATYAWSGVRPPVNLDGSSVFKLGSTVPVKFQLAGASSAIHDATARLFYSKVSNGTVGTELEALSTSSSDAGNVFRHDGSAGQYVFNLSTKTLGAGSRLLRIDLGDGVPRTVVVGLRR